MMAVGTMAEDMVEAILKEDEVEAVAMATRAFYSTMSTAATSIGHSLMTNSGQWGLKVEFMSIKKEDFRQIAIMEAVMFSCRSPRDFLEIP